MDDRILVAGLVLLATFAFMSLFMPRVVHQFNHNFHYPLNVKPKDLSEALKAAAANGRNV